MSPNPYVEGAIPDLTTMTGCASNGTVVFLDRKLTNSKARVNDKVKQILTSILREAIVTLHHEYFYYVDFGPDVRPQHHIVSHDLYCTCVLEADCPSVVATKVYLRDGGKPARTPDLGFFPTCPHVCPICGSNACYAPELSSKHRGIGWHCSRHGASHYWQYQGSIHRGTTESKPVS